MADRYWVGGAGNWSDTSHWSDTSGGSGGFSVPTSSDNAIFDSASSGVFAACTLDQTVQVHDLTTTSSTDMYITGTQDVEIGGSLALLASSNVNNGNLTINGNITFNSSSSETIETSNPLTKLNTTNGHIYFSGTGDWTLVDNFSGMSSIILTSGEFDTGGNTVTCVRLISSGSTARTLTLGASVINLSGVSGSGGEHALEFSGSNFTFNEGTSSIRLSGSSGISSLLGNGETFYEVRFNSTANSRISDSNTFTNLTKGNTSTLTIYADQTVTGTFTSGTGIVSGDGTLCLGNNRTITAAAVSLTSTAFRNITGAGAASPFTGSGLIDRGGNSGITFSNRTLYWVGGTGSWSQTSHWSTSSGGSGGEPVPLPQDDVIFDSNSFTAGGQTVTLNATYAGNNIDMSGVTNNPTLHITSSTNIFGDFILSNSMSFTASSVALEITFASFSSSDIDPAGLNFPCVVIFSKCSSGSCSLQDNLTATGIGFAGGTFNTSTFNVTCGNRDMFISPSIDDTTVNMGSGLWTISELAVTFEEDGQEAVVNKDTASVVFNLASNSGYLEVSNGVLTLNDVIIQGSGSGTARTFTTDTYYRFSNSWTEELYYADGHLGVADPDGVWTNESNLTDGNTATYASNSTNGDNTSNYLHIKGTTAPSSSGTHHVIIDRFNSFAITIYGRDGSSNLYEIGGGDFYFPEHKRRMVWVDLSELEFIIYTTPDGSDSAVVVEVYTKNLEDLIASYSTGYGGPPPPGSTVEISKIEIWVYKAPYTYDPLGPLIVTSSLELNNPRLLFEMSYYDYIQTTDLTITGNPTYSVLFESWPEDLVKFQSGIIESVNPPTLDYVSVYNSYADGSIPFNPPNSLDRGYNTNWFPELKQVILY